jgi:hypothetical protein
MTWPLLPFLPMPLAPPLNAQWLVKLILNALFERVSVLAGKSNRLFHQLITTATLTSGAIELVHTMRSN